MQREVKEDILEEVEIREDGGRRESCHLVGVGMGGEGGGEW
jgi:hypothetical protein